MTGTRKSVPTDSLVMHGSSDLIQIRDGLGIVQQHMLHLIQLLRNVALEYKGLPTLGFTHYQPAQLVTYDRKLEVIPSALLIPPKIEWANERHYGFKTSFSTTRCYAKDLLAFHFLE